MTSATSPTLLRNPRCLPSTLSAHFEDILEAEAIRTGQSKTTVLKAALAMYNSQDENIKNHWLLESAKF
nr:CopG family transcriptional regulator [Salmonella enterica]